MFASKLIRLVTRTGGYVIGAGLTSASIYLGFISPSSMRESPHDAAKRFEYKSAISDEDVLTLKTKGIVVIDDVLTPEQLTCARNEVIEILNKKKNFMNDGFQINEQEDLEVRTDLVLWISEVVSKEQRSNVIGDGLMRTLRQIRAIPNDLKSHGMIYDDALYGVPFVNQLACYDGEGANYVAHRDSPEENLPGTFYHPLRWLMLGPVLERELTIIIYLNESSWNSNLEGSNCSGNLRCYLDAKINDMTGMKLFV